MIPTILQLVDCEFFNNKLFLCTIKTTPSRSGRLPAVLGQTCQTSFCCCRHIDLFDLLTFRVIFLNRSPFNGEWSNAVRPIDRQRFLHLRLAILFHFVLFFFFFYFFNIACILCSVFSAFWFVHNVLATHDKQTCAIF